MSKLFSKIDPAFARCPSCKAVGNLRRSRARTFWERVVKATKVFKIYRCNDCGWRGIRFSITTTRNFIKQIAYLLILVIVTGYIIRYILTRYVIN